MTIEEQIDSTEKDMLATLHIPDLSPQGRYRQRPNRRYYADQGGVPSFRRCGISSWASSGGSPRGGPRIGRG